MNKIDIITALEDKNLMRPLLGRDPETWKAWKILFKAVFGLRLTPDERSIYKRHTGRGGRELSRVSELFAIVGRRGGKSYAISLLCSFIIIFEDFWIDRLAPGERGVISIVACDRVQSRIIFNYLSAILKSNKMFKSLIQRETIWEIETSKHVDIRIQVASFRTIRGTTLVACILDELAFMRDSLTGANPASEIVKAARPAIMESGGLLVGISSAFNCAGILYDEYREFYGKENASTLIWVSDTKTMNPTFSDKKIEKALIADKAHAMAEYFSKWREDISALYSLIAVENAIISGRQELPPSLDKSGKIYRYYGFVDPSGGRRDSFSLGISHISEHDKIIIDLVIERKSPFKPSEVVSDFAEILKAYRIKEITSDRYAAGFSVDLWRKHGIIQTDSELTASELYLNLLPLLSDNRVELPDNGRLKSQFMSLMRKTATGGKDSVVAMGGDSHADMANATAGVVWLTAKESIDIGGPVFGVTNINLPGGSYGQQSQDILTAPDIYGPEPEQRHDFKKGVYLGNVKDLIAEMEEESKE